MATSTDGRWVVGVLRLTLHIPGAHSLKEKRRVVKRIVDRVHAHFNVAIAEVAALDDHQHAELGVAVVANAAAHAHSVLQSVLNRLDGSGDFEVTGSEVEIL